MAREITKPLVLSLNNGLDVGGELTGVGWRLPDELTQEQWRAAGELLTRVEQSKQWWLGDWWNAGQEKEWGDGKAACEQLEIDYGTARNCGEVCKTFQLSRRRDNLTFTHHTEVSAIDDPGVQDRMLDWCEEPISQGNRARSTRELREQVRLHLDEQGWTQEEKRRRALVSQGQAIVLNQKADERLIRWAQFEGILVKVDRSSDWGNPFELGKDGDRDKVCDSFEVYFPLKLSLHARLKDLRGKCLACWCHPERCHGHFLAELANNLRDEEVADE